MSALFVTTLIYASAIILKWVNTRKLTPKTVNLFGDKPNSNNLNIIADRARRLITKVINIKEILI